ncbi:AraC family transcriptional regulator [Lederbergia citrea]|uniref:Helix-turn-helix transcriptional regulator n=1 Tax=Lederbergia citrea TaxID=2833581 RepID=A0A942URE2_9BACI|nr:AraC family transcriptional regulator [Lederbergia citrea]MBS4222634.1 helix-turn-helix transcriptional regulator [Lederbergia citrea]
MSLMDYLHGEAFLNQHAIKLSGDCVSFFVHYWGVTPYHYDNPLHKHSFFEVCYVVDGEGGYVDNGIETPLVKGTMFLSRPDIWHQIKSQSGLFLLFVAFDVIESESSETGIIQFRELATTEKIIAKVNEHFPSTLIWKSLLMQSTNIHSFQAEIVLNLAYSLLISLHQIFTDDHRKTEKIMVMRTSSNLHRAKLYIRDNLSQPLQLNDVACYLHISARHLSRLFSTEGESFTSYIRKVRIRRSEELLRGTKQSIKEIADETGFTSVHYFTRIFKSETGLPPGYYRKHFPEDNPYKK